MPGDNEVLSIRHLRKALIVTSYFKKTDTALKTFLLICSILLSADLSFVQDRTLTDDDFNNSGARQLMLVEKQNCNQADQYFKKDLERKTLFVLLQGGVAPVIYAGDKHFRNKFAVFYYDFGCISPDVECMTRYNYLVFDYLSATYGKTWRKEIRKDAIGLKGWRKKKNSL